MKTCPSCNTVVEDSAEVCSSCGFSFPPDTSAASRTVMGFPSISGHLEEPSEDVPPADPGKQTLFGFPALDGKGADNPFAIANEESEESEVEFEDDATHLIPAAQLQQEFAADARSEIAAVESHIRPQGSVASVWGIDEESEIEDDDDSSSTSVMSGAAFVAQNEEEGAFSTHGSRGNPDFQDHGTLMGMNLADFNAPEPTTGSAETNIRSTQFAIPAVQLGGASPPEVVSDDTSGEVHTDVLDSPTQMWNPDSLEVDEDEDEGPERKEMLKEVRETLAKRGGTQRALPAITQADIDGTADAVPAAEDIPRLNPGRMSLKTVPKLKGLPDPSTLRAKLQAKLAQKPTGSALPIPVPSLTPPPAKPKPTPVPKPDPRSPEPRPIEQGLTTTSADTTMPDAPLAFAGVLGNGTHMSKRGEISADNIEPRQPIGRVGLQQRPEFGSDLQSQPLGASTLDETSDLEDDFAFADTGIASAEIVEQVRSAEPIQEVDTDPVLPPPQEQTNLQAQVIGHPIESEPSGGLTPSPDDFGPIPEPLIANQTPQPFEPERPEELIPQPTRDLNQAVSAASPQDFVGTPGRTLQRGDEQNGQLESSNVQAFVEQPLEPLASVNRAQVVASIASGAILLIGGAIGVLSGASLVGIVALAVSILSAIGILGLGLLPLSANIKSVLWGLAGALNVVIGLAVLLLGVGPKLAGVVVCAAGLLAIGAAILPVLNKLGT